VRGLKYLPNNDLDAVVFGSMTDPASVVGRSAQTMSGLMTLLKIEPMTGIIDEFSRECLAIRINRKLKAAA